MGRYLVEDVLHPETGEVLVSKDKMMDESDAKKIVERRHRRQLKIRSILTCESKHGVCAKCYGDNLANGKPVAVGEAVGIIAAQSIGEPGTQLTMRTFHTGGIASAEDITQGLPRVEELFEARKPKHQAIISETSGDRPDGRNQEKPSHCGVQQRHFGRRKLPHSLWFSSESFRRGSCGGRRYVNRRCGEPA